MNLPEQVRAISIRIENHLAYMACAHKGQKLMPTDLAMMAVELGVIADKLESIDEVIVKLRRNNIVPFPPQNQNDFKIRHVFREVALEFNIPLQNLIGPLRTTALAEPRQIGCFICAKTLGRSTTLIGDFIDRDHATVVVAAQVANRLIQTDPEFRRHFLNIIERMNLREQAVNVLKIA